jgi:Family of unknown function (DUF5683)
LQSIAGESYAQTVADSVIAEPATVSDKEVNTASDTLAINDTTPVKKVKFEPIAKRAGLYAAIIPGAGQLYNRQYWKIPIVVAGMGAVVYLFRQNMDYHQDYRKAYLQRVQDPNNRALYPQYNADQLKQLQDNYRQSMDMMVLFGALAYAAQIMDAVASAHLKNFDISQDISMNVKPIVQPYGIGFGIAMNFK